MACDKFSYYLCRAGKDARKISLRNYDEPYDDIYLDYWIDVLKSLESALPDEDLIIYIVWDTETVRELPSYGNNVIVLLLMDEFCELPWYYKKVRFIFKTFGFFPQIRLPFRSVTTSLLVKLMRDIFRWTYRCAPTAIRHAPGLLRNERIMVVPLGYARQVDLPLKSFEERKYAISFVGSVKQRSYDAFSIRAILGTPKDIARSRMIRELCILQNYTTQNVYWHDSRYYLDGILSNGVEYSKIMADTKICLAPRGSSTETFRLFEGMRYGCVVICDHLPNHWFFEDCPVVLIDHWANLKEQVADLLRDSERLLELHRASLSWWERQCSAKSLAGKMAAALHQRSAEL